MHLKSLLALLLLTPWALTCLAGESIAVVTNKASKIDKLSLAEIRALYLGETRRLQSGKTVDIGDRDRTTDLHRDFYQSIAEMSPKDVAVHWAKKVFTGKATAPIRVAGDDEAAKAWVKAKPDAITYIAAKSVDGQVKVVGTLGP